MSVHDATVLELERLQATDSPEGQAALELSRCIDLGKFTPSAVPAMVKELRVTLSALRDTAPKAKDSIDDLAARRGARQSA